MLYRPPADKNALWDTWLIVEDGIFYLFSLTRDNPATPLWDSFRLATSTDCVHWTDKGVILRKDDVADWMGTGHTWKAGDKYILNYSECTGNLQKIRFAVSEDLLHWNKLGEEYDSHPNPHWYQSGLENSPTSTPRWDCIYVVPAEDKVGFYGFLTANTSYGHPSRRGTAGCVYSKDGIHFECCPPAINPGLSAEIEIGGVAKIGNLWYMAASFPHNLMGERSAWPDAANSGTQYLVSQNQTGPYELPAGNNRLLSAPQRWSYFGRFFRHDGRVFFNHHVIPACKDDGISFAPVKEVKEIAPGQIALFYWPKNDVLRGNKLPISFTDYRSVSCAAIDPCQWITTGEKITAIADGCAGINEVNLNEINTNGIIIDINIKFNIESGSAGIILATDSNKYALMIHNNGKAEVGTIHKNRYGWNIEPLHCLPDFIPQENKYHIKCLSRSSFAELYINDRLADVISLPFQPTGTGLIAEDCNAEFSELTISEMR